ncbi:MAG: phospho-N-acetylmuramoyl-pentapeptide-transferase [Chlamydiota bacterium]
MFLVFVDALERFFDIQLPQVFEFYSTRMILAAITTLILSIFMGPWFIRKLYSLKIGQPIRKEECPLLGELHEKKENTPTMGGILILVSMLIAMFLWMDLKHSFTLILFISTLYLGGIGVCDDYLKLKKRNSKGLSSRWKLVLQFIFAAGLSVYLLVPQITQSVQCGDFFTPPVAREYEVTVPDHQHEEKQQLSTLEYTSRLYVPFIKGHVWTFSGMGLILLGLFYAFVIVGTSNAVNLTDGLDGLATGNLLMVVGTLAVFAFLANNVEVSRYLNILHLEGSGEIAIYLCALGGACLGFLWYNGYPAQVFMGDTGSLALGGITGVAAVLLKRELLLAIIGGVFVAEAMSVIIQVASYRLRDKKRVFLCSPLHHHFEYKGWHEMKVVLRLWIVGLLLAFIGLATLKFQ